jgi:predicted P-loop ATPase
MSAPGPTHDHAIKLTIFPNFGASTKRDEELSVGKLADRITRANAPRKDGLPWLKLACFGDLRTNKNSLRHDRNVLAITGVEGDYDAGLVTFEEAVQKAQEAGILAITYTSPSHTEDAPRWRVLCPTSTELPPEQRSRLVDRLNGVLGGILAGESWTLSQSYYYGAVNGNPSHRVEIIDGTPIDLRDDLDATAIGKPRARPAAASSRPVNGAVHGPISERRLEAFRLAALNSLRREAAVDGAKHGALLRYATALGGIQAAARFTDEDAVQWLLDALPDTIQDWKLAERTARDGLNYGRQKPLALEDRPHSGNGATHPFVAAADNPAPPDDPPAAAHHDDSAASIKLGDKPWPEFLQRNDKGEAVNNLANAMTALRSAPELKGCFRLDEMLRVPVLVRPPPKGKPGILPRPVSDTDVSIVQEWLQRHELRRLGKDIVHQAVALRAEENAFHPVRDYLNRLRWDRKERLSTWLTYYAGVEPDDKLSDEEKADQRQYISAIGRMFFISMVARVMRPGCKVDYMLILESIQGEKKSTIGEILAGQWFSDSLPNIGSDAVRISQHLRGKWLIEIGELSAMSKTETEELKAFLTRKEEQFTPKYGRLEVTEPRQCVFMGTTNKATYLRDETGARRFWPAKAGTIDITALTEDRDQLFAEAADAYRSGEQWWPDRDFEKKFIVPQQEARRESDAWEQTIGDWLETPAQNHASIAPRTECTISEVAEHALRMEPSRLTRTDQLRISAALELLGWERGKRTKHNRPWVRRTKPPHPTDVAD